MLLFTVALSAATGLLFALLVVHQVRHASLHADLRGSGGRTATLLSGIQTAQVSMTFVLLLGAWLFVETLLELSRVDPGYRPAGLLVVQIDPPSPAYDDEAAAVELYSRLLDAVGSVPGVSGVALTNHGPGGLAGAPTTASVGAPPRGGEQDLAVIYRTVSPGYFATVGTRVVAGRDFQESDLWGGEGPVIVNETLATRIGGPVALGGAIGVRRAASSRADFGEALTGRVVGVVADLHPSETGGRTAPTAYVPFTHSPWGQVRLLVRTVDGSAGLVEGIEEAVRSVEPAIPLSGPFVGVRRMVDLRSARRSRAARMMTRAVLMGAVGLGAGVAGAVLLSSLVDRLLDQVSPMAAGRYVTVAAILLGLTVAAAWAPARGASRLDPAGILRSE